MLFRWEDLDPLTLNLQSALGPLAEFRRQLERAFDDLDRDWTPQAPPRPEIVDQGLALELTADLPGVDESDLTISLNKDVLTLSVRRVVAPLEGYRPHRQERAGFQVTRSFALPVRVDPEKVRANLKDGVLTVRMEKAPESRPRSVTVTVS